MYVRQSVIALLFTSLLLLLLLLKNIICLYRSGDDVMQRLYELKIPHVRLIQAM